MRPILSEEMAQHLIIRNCYQLLNITTNYLPNGQVLFLVITISMSNFTDLFLRLPFGHNWLFFGQSQQNAKWPNELRGSNPASNLEKHN